MLNLGSSACAARSSKSRFQVANLFSSSYLKEHEKSDSFEAFASKVFIDEHVTSLEKCKEKLEKVFEDNFKPERDFFDYLQIKKEREFENQFDMDRLR